MSKFVGRRGSVGLAIETARGVGEVPAFWLPMSTISFDDKVVTARSSEGLGKIADSNDNFVTQRRAEGEIECEASDKALGYILASLFGALPTSSGSNPYTHSFTLQNNNQHQSLTIFWQDPDMAKMFTLAVVDTFKMTVDLNGIVKYTFGFKSRGSRDWTAQSPSYTSLGSKFLHQHLSYRLAANVGALSGATALSLKKLELTIAANTIHDEVLGTVQAEDVLNQQFGVSGSIMLNKEDETYRRYMLDGTYRANEIKLDGGANSKFTLQLPRLDFTEWEQDRTLDTIVTQSTQFTGNFDAANALDIISTAELVNTQASYS